MSAWIASDKHVASVVIATIPEELRQTYADEIKKQNIRSVNYRYNERTKIEPCDLSQGVPVTGEDVVRLSHSLDYQSCERPDWHKTKAYRYLREIVFKVSFDLAPGGEWSI